MIVYGDPQITVTLAEIKECLDQLAATARSLDEVRSLLITAGELEQALADAVASSRDLTRCERSMVLTNAAARLFLKTLRGERSDTLELLQTLALIERHGQKLQVKVPEGFALYALYPEQYEAAARRWSNARRGSTRTVAVIGLRSIGTTLSAVVAETMRMEGWRVRRVTVRPRGHPYQRSVDLQAEAIRDLEFAIVVDEGPGRSGSSMAAVAQALVAHGFPRERVTFFPAHEQEPGPEASAQVRQCWKETERCVTDLREVCWNGCNLMQRLAEHASVQFKAEVAATHDLSAGKWRLRAFAAHEDWPAVSIPFERMKVLQELADGRKLVWKFEGFLAVRRDLEPTPRSLPQSGKPKRGTILRVPRLDRFHGFSAFPWVEGRRLSWNDLDDAMVPALAEYIVGGVGPALSSEEAHNAMERMAEMLVVNARNLLDERAAQRASSLAAAARKVAAPCAAYGDGRLQSHEFIRNSEGMVFKTDWSGHDADHTMIGRQPWLWDVAGLLVEWPDTVRQKRLLHAFQAWQSFDEETLRFYAAAYAAFRAGMMTLSEGAASAADRLRVHRAIERYREALRYWLNPPPLATGPRHTSRPAL
jgi:hypothetical protein